MKTLYQSHLILIGALAVAGAAYGQQPPDVVNSDAYFNTAMGTNALFSLTPSSCSTSPPVGCSNTASGYEALYSNTTGYYNTASGYQALYSNTTGNQNTASGVGALYFNTTGTLNTASGVSALYFNTTGKDNTASGTYALSYNTTGSNNTAFGVTALLNNTTGKDNTASGTYALYYNTTGSNNSASGYNALAINTTGSSNSASGAQALYANKTGGFNTASGIEALYHNTSGNYNIAEGYKAGFNLKTGSNNIEIGNQGVASDNNTIKIGTQGTQAATFIAGIYNTSVTGSAVMVSSTGQLGVTVSSERFKTAITPMGPNSAKLEQLRPVTFKLKSDATGTRQYGLIAEEVAKVYPELVVRDGSGRIDGVRYDELAPMLLNEVQKRDAAQDQQNAAQTAEIRDLKQQMAELKALNQATQVALRELQAKDEFVAQR